MSPEKYYKRSQTLSRAEQLKLLETERMSSDPADACREYMQQKPWERYSPQQTLRLARRMSNSRSNGPLFCGGMAYAEVALLSQEEYESYLSKARRLTKKGFGLADTPERKLYYAPRLYCLPLYAMPHIESQLSENELENFLQQITDPLDNILEIIRDASYSNRHNLEFQGLLRGAMTELSVLRALQRPDLIRSDFVALPALPWEEHTLRKDNIFSGPELVDYSTCVMTLKENRNYDISVASLKDPTQIIPLQIKSSSQYTGTYHESINVVTGTELATVICKERKIKMQSLASLMNGNSRENRAFNYKIIGDYLIDEVLKIS